MAPRALRRYGDCGSVPDVLIGSIGLITGDAMVFIDPGAEVDQLAAFTAEGFPAL